eukprot:CAMPEP_0196589934 /NCGR_PEP_ID=MMETSP1081-20130531/65044_1 /TAXON_ID=36882 /ORGANISM="Pyramimonas amylifera, Strain CCMP720" /LENGTH=375 /DNA_ID=CAMNT_0041912877 /DNA_START=123 /DNA_END=1250 /DNA_ORIENTATION=+
MASQANTVSRSLDKLSTELKDTTYQQQRSARDTVDRNFEQRLDQTEKLKAMLEVALNNTNVEIQENINKEAELEALKAEQEKALLWTMSMLECRSTERPVRERTDDKTQYSLSQLGAVLQQNIGSEKELINGCRTDNQKLHAMKDILTLDLEEKTLALKLDQEAYDASEGNCPTPYYVPPKTVGHTTMGAWIKNTELNCLSARRCIENSLRLRQLADIKMAEHRKKERTAVSNMLLELRANIAHTEDLIQKLEDCIAETQQKIADAETMASELETALNAKYPSMDLTKHRYTHRTTGRPAKELMGDWVHQALRDEYVLLDHAAQMLYDRMMEVHRDIDFLNGALTQLQDDLSDKQTHLATDKKVEASTGDCYPGL